MALTRKFLKAMGLTDEQVESVIEAHTETVDGLKVYKADAEKLPGVQKELDDLKAAGDGGYKKKYEDEHKAFEDYKTEQTNKETRKAKEAAYRALLKEAGMGEKYIDKVVKVTDIGALEMDGDQLKDKQNHIDTVKKDFEEFISTTTTTGTNTATPPAKDKKDEPDLGSMTMEEYIAARKKK